jgi:hypothetical protein
MDSTVLAALITVGGLSFGSALTLVGIRLNSEAAAKLEDKRNAQAERREARAFQRDTLLEAQVALTAYARAMANVRSAHQQWFLEHNKAPTPGSATEHALYDAQASLRHLSERVVDDDVRSKLTRVLAYDSRFLYPHTYDDVMAGWTEFGIVLDPALDGLGAKLRTYTSG